MTEPKDAVQIATDQIIEKALKLMAESLEKPIGWYGYEPPKECPNHCPLPFPSQFYPLKAGGILTWCPVCKVMELNGRVAGRAEPNAEAKPGEHGSWVLMPDQPLSFLTVNFTIPEIGEDDEQE